MNLNDKQTALCDENTTDFSDLNAVFFNCTLKHPDQASHTSLLMGTPAEIMRKSGVTVEDVRMTAHTIAFGVQPDMREHGWDHDDWPDLWRKVEAADIIVIGTPIWLGEQSSVAHRDCQVILAKTDEPCCGSVTPSTRRCTRSKDRRHQSGRGSTGPH